MEWDVLTARSVLGLLPVLDDFGQDVSVEQASDVREIYTLAFFQPAVMLNDIQTLYLEEKASAAALRRGQALTPAAFGRNNASDRTTAFWQRSLSVR